MRLVYNYASVYVGSWYNCKGEMNLSLLISPRAFPDSSFGKESTCNAGDPSSIPGLERSAGERVGYPLQSSWASLVAQLGKNLPAMRETWVQSLGWEDPLKMGKATNSSILAWRIPWTSPWSRKGSDMELDTESKRVSDFHFLSVSPSFFSFGYNWGVV